MEQSRSTRAEAVERRLNAHAQEPLGPTPAELMIEREKRQNFRRLIDPGTKRRRYLHCTFRAGYLACPSSRKEKHHAVFTADRHVNLLLTVTRLGGRFSPGHSARDARIYETRKPILRLSHRHHATLNVSHICLRSACQ